jgi:hypothetical protein
MNQNQQPQPERKATAKIMFDLDMAKKGEWVRESRSQAIGLIAYIIQAVEEKMERDRAKNGE